MRPPLPRCCSLGALALGAALLAATAKAGAQTPRAADPRAALIPRLPGITVHRTDDTADCPDAIALAALVARLMKRPALDPIDETRASAALDPRAPAPQSSLDVQLYRSEEGYTAVVQTGGVIPDPASPGGSRPRTRQLTDRGATCAGLTGALSITLAILLDTEVPRPPPAPPEPPPPSLDLPSLDLPPLRPPVPSPILPAPPPPPRFLGVAAGLALGPAEGVLQRLGLAGSGYLELRIGRRFSLAGGVLAFASQISRYTGPVQGAVIGKPEFETWLTAGLLRGCLTFPILAVRDAEDKPGGARAGGCLGVLAGAIHGEGHYLPRNGAATDPWASVEGSAIFEQPLFWRFALVSRVTILAPFVRRSFAIDTGTAFSPAPVGASLDAGIRLSIW